MITKMRQPICDVLYFFKKHWGIGILCIFVKSEVMKNEDQCKSGLLYKNFSIVLMQTFTSRYIDISEKELFRDKRSGDIDDQLFTHQERIIDRYELEGFSIRIQIDEPNVAVLEGHVQVLVAVFFDRTMQLSYRIVVPPGEGDENAVLPEEGRKRTGEAKALPDQRTL